jgi:serine/threonine protein kinase
MGELFNGRYRILEYISSGSCKDVVKAHDTVIRQREVVLKIFKDSPQSALQCQEKIDKVQAIQREVKILDELGDNKYTAKLLEAAVSADGRLYLVEEFIDGVCLDKYIEEHKLNLEDRLKILDGIARGLAHLHKKKIVHGDLKFANVLVEHNVPKLIDFGVAKIVGEQEISSGSLRYCAPEIFKGQFGCYSDIWSFGIIAYRMLNDRFPFYIGKSEARDEIELLSELKRQIMHKEYESINSIPKGVDKLVRKCLEKNFKCRYKDGAQLHRALVMQRLKNHSDYCTIVSLALGLSCYLGISYLVDRPDVKKAYISREHGNAEIYIEKSMPWTVRERVTYTPLDENHPRWCKDSLLFLRDKCLVMLQSDGKEFKLIENVLGFDYNEKNNKLCYVKPLAQRDSEGNVTHIVHKLVLSEINFNAVNILNEIAIPIFGEGLIMNDSGKVLLSDAWRKWHYVDFSKELNLSDVLPNYAPVIEIDACKAKELEEFIKQPENPMSRVKVPKFSIKVPEKPKPIKLENIVYLQNNNLFALDSEFKIRKLTESYSIKNFSRERDMIAFENEDDIFLLENGLIRNFTNSGAKESRPILAGNMLYYFGLSQLFSHNLAANEKKAYDFQGFFSGEALLFKNKLGFVSQSESCDYLYIFDTENNMFEEMKTDQNKRMGVIDSQIAMQEKYILTSASPDGKKIALQEFAGGFVIRNQNEELRVLDFGQNVLDCYWSADSDSLWFVARQSAAELNKKIKYMECVYSVKDKKILHCYTYLKD